jgi:hypothetical protein
LATERGSQDELVDRLVLDVKALALLHGHTEEVRRRLQEELANSTDDDVHGVVQMLQPKRGLGATGTFAVAVGELVLASFLIMLGTIAFIPTVVGIVTPQELVSYFADAVYAPVGVVPPGPLASFIELAFAIVLLIAAFYTLRRASLTLKEAGLSVHPGG